MNNYTLVSLAILAGGLVPLQGALNAGLGKIIGHPLQAAFISFLTGTVFIAVVIQLLNIGFPSLNQLRHVTPYQYIGGIMGVVFITANIILIPKVGVTVMVLSVIIGQISLSLVLDHNGYLEVPQKTLDINRFIGLACIVLGLFFMRK